MAAAVPLVATMSNFIAASARAISTARGLSLFLTVKNTRPDIGNLVPAPSCDLTNASPKVLPTPMTSPVDFISGPRIVSTPGNLTNGIKTENYKHGFSYNDPTLKVKVSRADVADFLLKQLSATENLKKVIGISY